MTEILPKLGELVLGSLPTIVFFLILVIAYSILVRRPLEKTLAERHSRTTGAVDQARVAISLAEAKTTEYEQRIRAARAEVYEGRQAMLAKWNAEREEAVNAAREISQQKVREARQQIEASANEAKQQLESTSQVLAQQVIKAVLPSGAVEAAR